MAEIVSVFDVQLVDVPLFDWIRLNMKFGTSRVPLVFGVGGVSER